MSNFRTMYKFIFFILILISVSGCEELEKHFNYINVTITGKVVVFEYKDEYNLNYVVGEPVEMSLIKAGGERVQETGTTGNDGATSITATFKLYKEQPIEFFAQVVNHPNLFDSTKLTWEQADGDAAGDGIGEARTAEYYYYFEFEIP